MVITCLNENFSPIDTLTCGQIFRFTEISDGKFLVVSKNKACVLFSFNNETIIECEDADKDYFHNYFDLDRDYAKIVEFSKNQRVEFLEKATEYGKGIRILNQDYFEMLISFVISQNNNIPRIKKIIEKLSVALGEKRQFKGYVYHSFPSLTAILSKDEGFYKSIGLGYRASYILSVANAVKDKIIDYNSLKDLTTKEIKKKLLSVKGIGEKVANCITLFGLHKSDSFPVDTWIEKIYKEDFLGKETSREKITEYFIDKFKDYSGYVQQYLFHYKRNFIK